MAAEGQQANPIYQGDPRLPKDVQPLFGRRRLITQRALGQRTVAIRIQRGYHLSSIAPRIQRSTLSEAQRSRRGGAAVEPGCGQIRLAHRPRRIAVNPIPGGHQVVRGQPGLAVHILAGEQRRLETGDERRGGQGIALDPAELAPLLAVRGQNRPIHALQRGCVELRDVAAFAGHGVEVALSVGEPGVSGLGVVAPIAAAHGVGQLRRAGGLGRTALGEIVHGALQILAQVQAPRVEGQVVGPVVRTPPEVDRVIEREVTVGALKLPRGVDVPGAAERGFIGQVHARVLDLLRRDDLASGEAGVESGRGGVPRFGRRGCQGERRLRICVHQAMTLAAVGIGRVLYQHELRLELALGVEGVRPPAIRVAPDLHQARPEQGGGVSPAELPALQRDDAGVVGRVGQVAQEAVHFHRARGGPIPRHRAAGGGIQHGGLRVGRVRGQLGQQVAVAGIQRGAAAHMAVAEAHHPFRRAQVKQGIAGRGQRTVAQRIPATECAGADVPRVAGVFRARTPDLVHAQGGVVAMGLDERRIVARAAGLQRGDRPARRQDVGSVGVQQGELRVQRRSLGCRTVQAQPGRQ